MNFPIGYGHEVRPQQAAVEPEIQEPAADPPPAGPAQFAHSRKRARVTGGRFAADNPATAVDEAWVES